MSRDLDPLDAIDSIFTRLNAHAVRSDDVEARLERLESARIAAPVAPESAETAPGVPVEPGNAPEAHSGCDRCPPTGQCYWCSCRKADELIDAAHAEAAETGAALRMYRKVQALTVAEACGIMRVTYELAAPEVTALLAWLKEGEA